MSIDYFISFTGRRKGDLSASTSRTVVTAQSPITGIDRIEAIEDQIRKKFEFESCAITNWRRFEEPTA